MKSKFIVQKGHTCENHEDNYAFLSNGIYGKRKRKLITNPFRLIGPDVKYQLATSFRHD